MLLELIEPRKMVDSVIDINIDELCAQGIRGILLDFDNTLLAWSDDKVSSKVKKWVHTAARKGLLMCIVSNAPDERLKTQAKRLKIPYVSRALKPTGFGINRALNKLGLERSEVAMVGDQMFTDVLAGNILGLFTVLVHPVYHCEQWWMKYVRDLERDLQKRMGLAKCDRNKGTTDEF